MTTHISLLATAILFFGAAFPTNGADNSISLPDNLRKEADACFAKGYTFFIWPSDAGPFRRGAGPVLRVSFNHITSDKTSPENYQVAFVIITKDKDSGKLNEQTLTMKAPKPVEIPRTGTGEAVHFDALGALSGKGTARVRLMDYATGTKQISNELTVDIEL